MKCMNCGYETSDNFKSCIFCGTNFVNNNILNNEYNVQPLKTNNKGQTFIGICYILILFFLISAVISYFLATGDHEGSSLENFKEYMQENGYALEDKVLTSPNYSYLEHYYIANKKNINYSIIYIVSSDDNILNNYYSSIKQTMTSNLNNKTNLDITLNNFNKYSTLSNIKYNVVAKTDNTILYTSANAVYKDNIDKIFRDLGYDYVSSKYPYILMGMAILVFCLLNIVSLWKIFKRSGRKGIISLVPIYNMYTLTDIALGNGWLFLILLIPVVNLLFLMFLYYKLSKMFGKKLGFTLGMIFLSFIFLPLLAFDNSEYLGIKEI